MNDSEAAARGREESRELSLATFGAMAGVVLSRLSGVIREIVLSIVFGAGLATDAFYTTYRYANSMRDLLAEGALSSAFTKSLVEAKARSRDAERALIGVVLGFFGLVTLLLAILGFAFARPLLALITEDSFIARGGLEPATPLFQILVFYLPITMLSASAMAILGTYRRTFHATFASAFFNLGTIAGALLFAPAFSHFGHDPILGLATGALVGGALQFLSQAIPLRRMGLLPAPNLSFRILARSRELRDVLKMMGPRALAQGNLTIALLINTMLATAGQGTMTYISKATMLVLVPVGLFGVAAGFASLPVLSEAVTQRDGRRFTRLLEQSLNGSLWLAFFSIVGFAMAALPFLGLFFEHGRFTRADAVGTAMAVCAYSVGVFFNSGSKVLQQGFFALGHTRQVVFNSLIYLAINAVCSYTFSRFDDGPVPFGLANSLATCADFSLNLFFLERICRKNGFSFRELARERGFRIRRVVALAVLAFGIAGAGIVWARSTDDVVLALTGFSHGFVLDFALFCGAGMLGLPLVLGCTLAWGPAHLRELLVKVLRRLPVVRRVVAR